MCRHYKLHFVKCCYLSSKLTSKMPSSLPRFPFTPACKHTCESNGWMTNHWTFVYFSHFSFIEKFGHKEKRKILCVVFFPDSLQPSDVHMSVTWHGKRPGGPKHSLGGWEVSGLTLAHGTSRDPFLFVHSWHTHRYGHKWSGVPLESVLSPSGPAFMFYKGLLKDVRPQYWVMGIRWISV